MPRDLFTRPGTTTDAVIDIFVDRLSRDELRKRFADGRYGKCKPEWIKGWLGLRGGLRE